MKTAIKTAIIILLIGIITAMGFVTYLKFIPFDIDSITIEDSIPCDAIFPYEESNKINAFCHDENSVLSYNISLYENKTLIDTLVLKKACRRAYEDYGISNEVDNFYKGKFEVIAEDFKVKCIYFDKVIVIIKAGNTAWEYFLDDEIDKIVQEIGV